MNLRKTILGIAVAGIAFAALPAAAAKRNVYIAGPAMVARYDMDVNLACSPNDTLINRGFVEQQCTYFFPLTDAGLKGQFVGMTLIARDDNAVFDVEARLVRKRYDTEDAFDDPDTMIEVETEDDDNDLRRFEGIPLSTDRKIEANKFFYYVEVIIPDVNLGVVGVIVRYDDKTK